MVSSRCPEETLSSSEKLHDYLQPRRPRSARLLRLRHRPAWWHYRLSAYQYDKDGSEPLSDRELSYIVANRKGRLFYRAWGKTRPMPLKTWLRGAIKNVQKEMAHKPGLPNRFDAGRHLRELPQLPL